MQLLLLSIITHSWQSNQHAHDYHECHNDYVLNDEFQKLKHFLKEETLHYIELQTFSS